MPASNFRPTSVIAREKKNFAMARWFDKTWIGQIIKFEKPLCSWKIVEKLCEHEMRFYQEEFEQNKFYSESCRIFICEDTKDSTRAIMKIRMQYAHLPW